MSIQNFRKRREFLKQMVKNGKKCIFFRPSPQKFGKKSNPAGKLGMLDMSLARRWKVSQFPLVLTRPGIAVLVPSVAGIVGPAGRQAGRHCGANPLGEARLNQNLSNRMESPPTC